MYPFSQQAPILLQFRLIAKPIAVSVPGHVLIYLDTHAERTFAPDGSVIYHQPEFFGQEVSRPLPRS